ncbi:MAG: hypothetical protein IKE46_00765 [Selenomonadaceae bacterium]|nr:hypothetical protein [Selenomonadaceae bacterium]
MCVNKIDFTPQKIFVLYFKPVTGNVFYDAQFIRRENFFQHGGNII